MTSVMHPIQRHKAAFRLEQLKLLHIYLIFMCYDISTVLFDTNMKRLYMCAKPSQHGQLPRKSCMADSILFTKENIFCTTFQSAIGWSACGLAYV